MGIEDYKYEVMSSLQVLKNKREKIYSDTVNYNTDLYTALHSSNESATRHLYIQYYETIWLSEHWNDMTEIIENNPELRDWDKRSLTVFFSKHFSKLIDGCSEKGLMTKLAIAELLKLQKQHLSELIRCSDKWEENSKLLKLQTIKNKENFKRLINEAKNRKENY